MVFCVEQKVLFKHCDPAGIVFYPRYFEMINDLVEDWFGQGLSYPFEKLLANAGVPTVEISTRFTAPSHHGDRLTLSLSPNRIGNTSLTLQIEAHCDKELRFSAKSALVHVDNSGRPDPWPDLVRNKILQLIEKEAKHAP